MRGKESYTSFLGVNLFLKNGLVSNGQISITHPSWTLEACTRLQKD
jgi:hypothetical protein